MTKYLALTVSPTEALNVLNGKQTALLRKRVPKGYVGWCYGVVSGKKPRLSVVHDDENGGTYYYLNSTWGRSLNGDTPFRFWYEEVGTYKGFNPHDQVDYIISKEQLKALNTSLVDIWNYASNSGFKDLYAISITKLEVFYKPMELGEMYYFKGYTQTELEEYNHALLPKTTLTKSPSTYQYVWVKEKSK